MAAELVETWDITNRINLYLLDAVPVEGLAAVAPTGGRPVGATAAGDPRAPCRVPGLLLGGEGRIEGDLGRIDLRSADEVGRLLSARLPLHTVVLPFD